MIALDEIQKWIDQLNEAIAWANLDKCEDAIDEIEPVRDDLSRLLYEISELVGAAE